MPGSLIYDIKAKNVLQPNSDWNWGQVTSAVPELANLPNPAWLTQGATGRVALLGTPEYPQKNLYTTNVANFAPRLGISWAVNDKTVLHLSAGTVDQGLNGLSTDWLSFYYNSNTFNQVPTHRRPALDQRIRHRSRAGFVPRAFRRRQSRLGATHYQQQGLLVRQLRSLRQLRPDRERPSVTSTPRRITCGASACNGN